MPRIVYLLLFLYMCSRDPLIGRAGEWHLLEPREVSVDAFRYKDLEDPYLAPVDQEIKQGGSFRVDFNFLRLGNYRLFMDNRLHFDQVGEKGPVKHAGWQYELGGTLLNISGRDLVEGFLAHHSRHVLDESRQTHFPNSTSYGLRLILFRKN